MREGDQMDDLLLSMDDLLDSAADRRELYRLVGVVDKARFSHPGSDLEFRFKCAAFADEPDTRGVVSVVLSATGQVASADVPAPASGPVYPIASKTHKPDPLPQHSCECKVEGLAGDQRIRNNLKGLMPSIEGSTALDEEQCLAALEGMREGDQMDDLLLSMDDLLDSAADRRELYRLVGVVDKARFSHPGSDLEFRFKCAAFADEPDTRGVVSVVLSATGQVASADVPAPASGPVYPAAAMAHTPDPPPKNSSDCQVEGFTSLISSAVAPVARLAATLSATAAAGPNAAPTVPPDTAESSHLSGAQDVFIGTHTSATDKVPNDILSEVTNSQAPSNPQSTARSDPAPSAPASAPAVFGPTPPRRVSLLFSSRGIGAARTSAQPLLSPPTRSLRAHRQLRAHTEGYEETTTVSLTPSSHTPARHTPKQRTPTSHVAATTIAPKRRRIARSSASMRGLFSDGSGDNGADNSGDSGDHHGGGGGGSVAPTPTKSASHMPARKKPAAHSRAEGLTHGKAHAHEAGDADAHDGTAARTAHEGVAGAPKRQRRATHDVASGDSDGGSGGGSGGGSAVHGGLATGTLVGRQVTF